MMMMLIGLRVKVPISNAFHIDFFFFFVDGINKLLLQRPKNIPFYSAKIKQITTTTESLNERKYFFLFSLYQKRKRLLI